MIFSQAFSLSARGAGTGPALQTTPPSLGTVFHVNAVSGNDNNNGTSSSSAWRTSSRAASVATGSTVLFYNGTYGTFALNGKNGSASNYTVFKNAPGQSPVFIPALTDWQTLQIDNCSYLCIQGLEFAGLNAQLSAPAPANSEVPPYTLCGINSGNSQGPLTVHHLSLFNNYCHDNAQGGINVMFADYVTIAGNTIVGNSLYSGFQGSGISLGYLHNFDTAAGYHNFILQNLCHDNRCIVANPQQGIITDGEGIIVDDNHNDQNNNVAYTSKTLVANNVCYSNGSSGITAFDDNFVDVIYNTCYFNCTELTSHMEIDVGFSNGCNVVNNILVAASGASSFIQTQQGSGLTASTNLLFGGNGGAFAATVGSGNINANPQFVSAPSDFTPNLASPAVGRANGSFTMAVDFFGAGRPSLNADLGAIQHLA